MVHCDKKAAISLKRYFNMSIVSLRDRDPGSVVGLGAWALVLAAAGVVFPPAVLPAMILAHLGWWKCIGSDRVRGFGWAMAAMIGSHSVFALWLVLVGAIVGGSAGVGAACFLLMLLLTSYAVAMRSAAVKYAIVAACSLLVILGLAAGWIVERRDAARRNDVVNNLRKMSREMLRDAQFEPDSDGLVRMHVTSFRDKDRMRLPDVLEIDLIDETWPACLVRELATRLQELIDRPEG